MYKNRALGYQSSSSSRARRNGDPLRQRIARGDIFPVGDVPLQTEELADADPQNQGELRCDAERAACVVARLRPEQCRGVE